MKLGKQTEKSNIKRVASRRETAAKNGYWYTEEQKQNLRKPKKPKSQEEKDAISMKLQMYAVAKDGITGESVGAVLRTDPRWATGEIVGNRKKIK